MRWSVRLTPRHRCSAGAEPDGPQATALSISNAATFVDDARCRRSNHPHFRQAPPFASPIASPKATSSPASVLRRVQLRDLSLTTLAAGEATAHTSDKTHRLLRRSLRRRPPRAPRAFFAASNFATFRSPRSLQAKQPPTLPTRPTVCFADRFAEGHLEPRERPLPRPTPRPFVDHARCRRSNRPHFRQDPPFASPIASPKATSSPASVLRRVQLRDPASTTLAAGEATAHTSDKTHRLLRRSLRRRPRRSPRAFFAASNASTLRRRRSLQAKQPPTLPTRPTVCFADPACRPSDAFFTCAGARTNPSA
jgi:hypothetical protein